MRNTTLFLLSILSSIFVLHSVNAGLVPGTVEIGKGTSTVISCTESTSQSYNTGYTCETSGVKTTCSNGSGFFCMIDGNKTNFSEDDCVANRGSWEEVVGPDVCREVACEVGDLDPGCVNQPVYTTSRYTNYIFQKDSPTFISLFTPQVGKRILKNDEDVSCYRSSNGSNHTSPSGSTPTLCENNNGTYYSNSGSDGNCTPSLSIDYDITQYDQSGIIRFIKPSDNDGACFVEGRYAQIDDIGPKVMYRNAPFGNDEGKWCNYNKYTATGEEGDFAVYGTEKNPVSTGCEYYNKGVAGSPDLLKDLEVSVGDLSSGVRDVQIELGTCSTPLLSTASVILSDIVADTRFANGIKPELHDTLIFYALKDSTPYNGKTYKSLLELFNENKGGNPYTRLDQCLGEGKNYLQVTARDLAVDNKDAKTIVSNTTNYKSSDSSEYIRIDNSGVSVDVTGDLDSPSTWYNKTVTGTFTFTDKIGGNSIMCTEYTKCSDDNSNPANSSWVSEYVCTQDPDLPQECSWECDSLYFLSDDESSCVGNAETYSWAHGAYGSCSADDFQRKTVSCNDSGGNMMNTSFCDPEELSGEDIEFAGEFSYTIRKSCSVVVEPPITGTGCLTLGSSTLGGTGAYLCSN